MPQGSVLGPLFFILCMNDNVKSVSANNIKLCADDTGVFMHNKNIHNLIKQAKASFRNYKNISYLTNLTYTVQNLISVYFIQKLTCPRRPNEIVVDDVKIKRSAPVSKLECTYHPPDKDTS